MRNHLTTLSDLTRLSEDELTKLFKINFLLSEKDYLYNLTQEGDSEIELPGFGKLLISDNLDIKFLPEPDFRKSLSDLRKNPNLFLKEQLKTLLIGGN